MRRHLFPIVLLAVVSLLRTTSADLQPIARLHFQAQDHAAQWIEGFAKTLEGTPMTYQSHRDQNATAIIARANGLSMSWQTAPAPQTTAAELSFLWTAAVADKGSKEEFE